MPHSEEKNPAKRFADIKQCFFPRWDRTGSWKLRVEFDPKSHGYCDKDHFRIVICHVSPDLDQLDLLLIHEIVHAIHSGHGTKWLERIGKAALRAEKVGRCRLAKLLRNEVQNYQQSPEISFEDEIEEWVINNPEITWESITLRLRDEYRLEDIPNRLERAYKRAKHLYGSDMNSQTPTFSRSPVRALPKDRAKGSSKNSG